ncbi:hypothetical protein [Bifidobacterium crudilactis]|uniref:hypothetical protein n=1 Tax=Bifidobacterium crudilactis TaxID=327277 RepID=UPI002353AE2D|nr:hypothetical protein [Bifidobacterium crudilactis]MCI1217116.1 hypothetical protein [Bifidobacterium crudilactis]
MKVTHGTNETAKGMIPVLARLLGTSRIAITHTEAPVASHSSELSHPCLGRLEYGWEFER